MGPSDVVLRGGAHRLDAQKGVQRRSRLFNSRALTQRSHPASVCARAPTPPYVWSFYLSHVAPQCADVRETPRMEGRQNPLPAGCWRWRLAPTREHRPRPLPTAFMGTFTTRDGKGTMSKPASTTPVA